MAFHDDLWTLANHNRTSTRPDIRDAAQRLLTGPHALIPEPARTEWAEALTYTDGEVRYLDRVDEEDARDCAALTNQAVSGGVSWSDVARAYPVFREVRVLVDGTQIIGPWLHQIRTVR
ncbi:hypothetical protein [Melissospora conviva]|uniref:hypothetical protein n=1 Tax=Melissospora conviva TaxID=3388432 RepID=UPI003C21EBE9